MANQKNPNIKFWKESLKIKEEECKSQRDKFGTNLYRLWRKTFLS